MPLWFPNHGRRPGSNLVCWGGEGNLRAPSRARRDGAAVEMFDILAPVLMIAGAIVVVALVYLLFVTLKDRNARKGDDERER